MGLKKPSDPNRQTDEEAVVFQTKRRLDRIVDRCLGELTRDCRSDHLSVSQDRSTRLLIGDHTAALAVMGYIRPIQSAFSSTTS